MVTSSQTTVASVGTNGLLAFFGIMTLQDWAAAVGLVGCVGTFAINWYYRCREDRRREREVRHRVRLERERYGRE